jgi:prepilin-type N-terminal cleavage/methylation domain-containing protein
MSARVPANGPRRRQAGFTLVELLVAAMITVVALSLAVALVGPTSVAFHALPEATDNQQRLRIAAAAIADDIAAAGAGPILGWGATALPSWPAVLPCRWTGAPLASMPGGCARDDAITLVTVPASAPQGVITGASGSGGLLHIAPLSACEPAQPACRLDTGSRALLIDGAGAWDVFLVTSVSADGRQIGHAQATLSRAASPGSLIGAVEVRAYSLKLDAASHVMQLRRGYGGASDSPVVDQVTGLSFAYLAEAAPPLVMAAGSPDDRSTTYGPLPPSPGADNVDDGWPAGENCVFRLEGTQQVSRLEALPPDADGLATLPLAALNDGPWCPDAASPNRWDADLLRIRVVRVALRVQPSSPAVRGVTAGQGPPVLPLDARRWVPDLEVRFDVALRNRAR